jgi:outer membrane protein OmpA-like peptidoglycan-associated protein/opacity protein-like surface antigen
MKVLSYALFFTLTLAVSTTHAQNSISEYLNPFEIGVAGGVMSYEGDVSRSALLNSKEMFASGGVFVRKHFNDRFALRGNFLVGKIAGKDLNYPDDVWRKQRLYSFSSHVSEVSAQLEWNILGNHRAYTQTSSEESEKGFRFTRYTTTFKRTALPYLFAGGGAMTTDPVTTFHAAFDSKNTSPVALNADITEGKGKKTRLGLHAGGGLNVHVAPNWVVGGELGFRTAFTDYFDGISQTANPDRKDWYLFGGLNISYRFIKTNSDTDGDGVPNKDDACPNVPGLKTSSGCPAQSQKPVVKEELPVVVQDTPKPVVPKPVVEVVKPEPVKASPPPPIEAPKEVVRTETTRPTTSVPAVSNVVLEKAEEETINYALQGVQFETSKSLLLPQSYKSLNDIVIILERHPTYQLIIEGNTDNRGNEASNEVLSQRRAEACLNYFVSKGITPDRLKAVGLGSRNPIGENKTLAGQQKNRRVEFKLLK